MTVEAVARSFEPSNGPLTLRLMDGQTRLTAYLDGWRTLPQYLLGARVRLTGACGSSANSRRQFNGIEVYAVSYTHLDVYKRQALGRLRGKLVYGCYLPIQIGSD